MSSEPMCPPVWQSNDAELLAELGALETRLHSTWAQMLSVVAEIDSRGMASGLGYRNTVEMVRAIARVSRGEARARVDAAADVLPRLGVNGAPVDPKLPTTAAAVADHAIGAADVAVIRSVLARIPRTPRRVGPGGGRSRTGPPRPHPGRWAAGGAGQADPRVFGSGRSRSP